MNQHANRLLNHPYLKFFLIWAVTFLIGLQIRLFPLQNYSPEIYSERASLYVVSKLKEKVNTEIDQKYPGISKSDRNFLSKKLFDEIFHREREHVKSNIDMIAREMQKKDPKGRKYPYLLASDSYYYLYLTQQIADTGRISPEIKGSKYFHPLMFAPKGFWEPITLHPYSGYFVYEIMKMFNPSVDLMLAVSFASIVMFGIILLFFLILCRILNFSWLSTFVGSVFFVLTPIFVKRSTFAWYDNDPPNILFPILIFIFLFLGLKNIRSQKLNLSFAILSSVFILIYSLFWQGWVFFFSMIFLCSIFILIYQNTYLKDKSQNKQLFKFFGSICFITILLAVIAFGIKDFLELFQDGFKALSNFLTPELSIWPDLYISVGELHKADPKLMIDLTGGIIVFIIFSLGILIALRELFSKKSPNFSELIILILFSVISLKLTLGAQRFALLCVVPVSLLFIYALDQIIRWGNTLLLNIFKNRQPATIYFKIILTIIFISTIYFPILNIHRSISSLLNPIYNDTWNKTFEQIKTETPKNSIINTWWPPGHFIKAMANRRVTFDGATINIPQAYWILNFFSSTTEKEALGILRMLNNSGNEAVEYLESQGFKISSSVSLLKQITQLDDLRAKIILNHVLKNPENVNHLLSLTHKTPLPSYTLIYNEFAENSLEMGLFGRWNFEKIEKINADPELQKKIPARNSKEYIKFLWDLSGGPTHHSPKLVQVNQINNMAIFDENLKIDLTKMECTIDSKQYGKGAPISIFYLFNNQVVEKQQPQADLPYSVVLYPDENGSSAILMDREIAQSMMVRLFYFGGRGLKYFEKLSDNSDITNRTHISVFKIKWDEFEKDLRID